MVRDLMHATSSNHAPVLKQFYDHLTHGRLAEAAALGAESFTFQVPGKSPLAGKYTRATFASELGMKLRELSSDTYQLEVHDILVSELHATVLMTERLTRGDKPVEWRSVHVWRFEGGKPLAGYEYPRDLYQYDQAWSG